MAMTALDKERQRQRALNQTAAFLAHGHQAPTAPIPKPAGPKDMKGREFKVGMKMIRPCSIGNSNGLKESTITHIAGPCVYVDGSRRPLGKPERCYILS